MLGWIVGGRGMQGIAENPLRTPNLKPLTHYPGPPLFLLRITGLKAALINIPIKTKESSSRRNITHYYMDMDGEQPPTERSERHGTNLIALPDKAGRRASGGRARGLG